MLSYTLMIRRPKKRLRRRLHTRKVCEHLSIREIKSLFPRSVEKANFCYQ